MPRRPPHALLLTVALTLAGTDARADKKGAGLFDFRGWSTPVGEERSPRGMTPGRFDLTPAAGLPDEVRSVRLRFYVDRDYRSLVLRWQRRLRAQLERINAIVEPVFALRFEIESLRDWDRSHAAMPLDPIVDELAALDPAREVDMVIGLVTPMRGVATSMHQIGSARSFRGTSCCAGWTTSRRSWRWSKSSS